VIKAAAAAAALIAAFPLLVMVLVTASPETPAPAIGSGIGVIGDPTVLTTALIPPDYLTWYTGAAKTCPGLPWPVLAGIGEVDSDHGRSKLPGIRAGANAAGAEGPMQLLPATFAKFAVNADPGQPASPYDPADAIYTAARMLCASGARGGSTTGLERAIFAYHYVGSYVAKVMFWARTYGAQGSSGTAAAAIAFAKAQLGKPYQWGAAGPDAYDCSGLVYAAYAAAGIQIARTTYQWQQDGPVIPLYRIKPGDLLFSAGSDGTPATSSCTSAPARSSRHPRPARTSRSTPST